MMKTKRALVIVILILLVALGGGVAWWQSSASIQNIVTQSLPALPELRDAPATMREQITAADQRARS